MGTRRHAADVIMQAEEDLYVIQKTIETLRCTKIENQDALCEVILVYIDKALQNLSPKN